jgi:ribose transport system substrate-binding protein
MRASEVVTATDPSALGALRAFEEVGRLTNCLVVGQSADPKGRAELRKADTPFDLALEVLTRKPTPPAVFTNHQLITRHNVDHVYPNDGLPGL